MALKIISSSQPIEVTNLTICLYAPPSAGKTSTAFTAKNPLLLDFDKGSYRSQFRKDIVQIDNWSDVMNITEQDLATYDTIVVDTAGRALDALSAHLIKGNPKFKGFGGQLSLQGFGALKATFITWLNTLRSFGKDVILIAHMDEQMRGGDTVVERLDIQGGAKNEIYKAADLMGRIRIEGQGYNMIRKLDFNPSESGFGKNPAQLDVKTIPNFKQSPDFFATVIDEVKATLNQQSAEAVQAQKELDDIHAKFSALMTIEEFNAEIDPTMPNLHKSLLLDYARKCGFILNKETKEFEEAAK